MRSRNLSPGRFQTVPRKIELPPVAPLQFETASQKSPRCGVLSSVAATMMVKRCEVTTWPAMDISCAPLKCAAGRPLIAAAT